MQPTSFSASVSSACGCVPPTVCVSLLATVLKGCCESLLALFRFFWLSVFSDFLGSDDDRGERGLGEIDPGERGRPSSLPCELPPPACTSSLGGCCWSCGGAAFTSAFGSALAFAGAAATGAGVGAAFTSAFTGAGSAFAFCCCCCCCCCCCWGGAGAFFPGFLALPALWKIEQGIQRMMGSFFTRSEEGRERDR